MLIAVGDVACNLCAYVHFQAIVAYRRIREYLDLEELKEDTVISDPSMQGTWHTFAPNDWKIFETIHILFASKNRNNLKCPIDF